MLTYLSQTVDPLDAPDKPEDFTLFFAKGLPVKLVIGDKTITDPVELFLEVSTLFKQ